MKDLKMKHFSTLGVLTMSLLLSGCGMFSSFANKTTLVDRQGMDVVMDHNTGVGFIITDPNVKERFCKTPDPDILAAETKSEGLSLGGLMPTAPSGNDSLTESQGFLATTLGGRNPSVLITRDILYRMCEMTSNLQMNSGDTVKAYLSALDRITEIIKAQNATDKTVPTTPSSTGSQPATAAPAS